VRGGAGEREGKGGKVGEGNGVEGVKGGRNRLGGRGWGGQRKRVDSEGESGGGGCGRIK